ncbi:MAG TPA: hypothetical protein VIV61_06055 [Candidatus Ozemobacteraceae bacterium]
MGHTTGNISLSFFLTVALLLGQRCPAETLKLADAPLSQIIELYSKATGKNVFVDETVQQSRKVTAHLQDMDIEEAFGIVQKTIGLESCPVGSNTLLLYPPERAQKYRPEMQPFVVRIPTGIDSKWILGLINGVLPAIRVTPAAGDQRALLAFGSRYEMDRIGDLTHRLPELRIRRDTRPMPEAEAKLAATELKPEEVELACDIGGLTWSGSERAVRVFREKLAAWKTRTAWGGEVFTPAALASQQAFKAAETIKGRAVISDLGGSGSLLVEGPAADRKRILEILAQLDRQSRKRCREVLLGEMKPETAREALKELNVETLGERRMVLIGRDDALTDAEAVLASLGRNRKQVVIKFRLAEITKSKLKTLGIDLDKKSYGYGEIRDFHGRDSLPLLLQVLNEGKEGKILAEPNLRVIEGEEAKVTIGDRIPLEVAATAQTDSGSTLKLNTQLNWVDVGIKMTVRNLAVNPDGSIRMGLKGEVSSVVATTKQGYPQIRTREAESTLRVNDGGLIVMGGLLSREERSNANRIPVIGDLPLFGGLARSRDRQKLETEIIMIVSARLAED